jgi:hypothetical protein
MTFPFVWKSSNVKRKIIFLLEKEIVEIISDAI